LRSLLFLFLVPGGFLREELGLEAAAFDLHMVFEDLGLNHKSFLVLNHFDSARVDTVPRVEALAHRVAVLLKLAQHVLLLARGLLDDLHLCLLREFVLQKRLRVEARVHFRIVFLLIALEALF